MVTFRVTAPDGRQLKITGDTMPTEQELTDIFNTVGNGAGNGESEKSLLNTLENTAMGLYQGITGNLIDEIAGAIHGSAIGLVDAVTGRGDGTFSGGYKRGYEQKRDEYRRLYDRAKTENPKLTMTGEIVGGMSNPLMTKAGAAIKGGKMAKAVKEGAAFGALTGLGASTADNTRDIAADTFSGAVTGAVLAPVVPAVMKSGRWVKDLIHPAATARERAVAQLTKDISADDWRKYINRAAQYGTNVAATGDDKVLSAVQTARQQSPEAANMIESRLQNLADSRPEVTRRNVGIVFGNSDKYGNIDSVVEHAKTQASPLYEALRRIGDLDAYALGKKGSKELGGRLSSQKFSDIEFGRMKPEKLAQLNAIRAANGLEALTPDMKIPLNVVKKLYDKRIVHDKMKPGEVADMVFDTFYNPDSIVDASKYPHIQALIKPDKTTSNVGFIAQNPANGETVVKSAYTKDNERLKGAFKNLREALEGRGSSPHQFGDKTPVAVPRFSALQSSSNTTKLSSFGKYVKGDDFIQERIKAVRKDTSLPKEVRQAADTDFRILDEVQRDIGDMIDVAKRNGENSKVLRLTVQKNELLKQMDKIAPQYKQARNYYEGKAKALRAQAIGEDIFNSEVSPAALARKVKDMDWLEQRSLKIGAGAELLRRIGQAQNEAVALGRLLNDNTFKKLQQVYGKPAARVFKEYAESEVLRNRNTNRLLSGSQTSEKQSLRDKSNFLLNLAKNPMGIVGETLGFADNRIVSETNKAIADLLTDPRGQALLQELDRQAGKRQNRALLQLLENANVATAAYAGTER